MLITHKIKGTIAWNAIPIQHNRREKCLSSCSVSRGKGEGEGEGTQSRRGNRGRGVLMNMMINDQDDSFRNEADELFESMFQDEDSFIQLEETAVPGRDIDEHYNNHSDHHQLSREEQTSHTSLVEDTNISSYILSTNSTIKSTITDSEEPELMMPDLSTLLLTLAPASEIAYFYLKNTIGLSEETMWKITHKAGAVLGFTVPNLEHKISLLRRCMNLTDEDLRTILQKQPSILHMSANRNISPTILFLVRSLDLSKEDLRTMVVQYPCILCYSIKNLRGKLKFFYSDMGYDHDHDGLRQLLVKDPRLLCAAVTTGLQPRFKFLHREMGIPRPELRSIVSRNPKLLLYSLEKNLQLKLIYFFIMRLQMEPRHIYKILYAYPFILDYNLEDHMLPIARYFLTDLEFSATEFRGILLKFPRLMTHSMFKIKHVVGYLRYALGMDAKQVKRVLFQAPQVISLETDVTLVSKVEFLRDSFGLTGGEVEGDDLRRVIAGMPTLLLCSVEKNLKPKTEFLLEEFDGDLMELRQAILTLPTLLGYSLEKRIRPRMKRILDAGVEPIKITVGITMKDENFDEWLLNKKYRLETNQIRRSSDKGPMLRRKDAVEASAETEQLAIVLSEGQTDADRKGRIVHWKR